MSFLTRALTGVRSITSNNAEKRGNPLDNPATNLANGFMFLVDEGRRTEAGEVINTRTSLQEPTVFACVRTIAEAISALPLRLLKVSDNGREAATDEALYHLLAGMANEETTSVAFWESQVTALALKGNGYAQIQRDAKSGEPIALWQLHPDSVTPLRDTKGNLIYRINTARDGETAQYTLMDKSDILHFKLFGFTGLTGLSVIEMARDTIGLGRAQMHMASRVFRNGSVPSLALINKASGTLISPATKTKIKEDWEQLQTGTNTHRVAVVDADWELQKLGFNNEESQFLESRGMTVEQICGLFKVPSNMVGSQAKATHANLEQQNLLFLTQCLVPYLTRIEAEVKSKLLPRDSRFRSYTVAFDDSMLRRGDVASTTAYYQAAIQNGWLSAAEVRHMEGLNIAPASAQLDKFRIPVNYTFSDLIKSAPTQPVTEPDGDEPANVRMALQNYTVAYSKLFTDAVRRVASGEELSTVLTPLLDSLYDHVATTTGAETDQQRMSEFVVKLAKRSETWTAESAEAIAADELKRTVRAFIFGSFEQRAKELMGD